MVLMQKIFFMAILMIRVVQFENSEERNYHYWQCGVSPRKWQQNGVLSSVVIVRSRVWTLLTYDVSLSVNLGGASCHIFPHGSVPSKVLYSNHLWEDLKSRVWVVDSRMKSRCEPPTFLSEENRLESIRFHTLPRNDLILERGYLRKKGDANDRYLRGRR